MGTRAYPYRDCLWIGSNAAGHLAAFVTAGEGLIPASALDERYLSTVEAGNFFCASMPIASPALLLPSPGRLDDFLDLAKRGLFVYDWTDVHASKKRRTDSYELLVMPVRPIHLRALPEPLAQLAQAADFGDLDFEKNQSIDVCAYMECIRGE